MINVSNAWKDIQQRFLLPETYIEIDCGVVDDEAQSVANARSTNEATFSNASGIVDGLTDVAKYSTLEHNLWSLDGTHTILPSSGEYSNAGYVSNIESTGSVTISFLPIRTTAISGITITWSKKLDEYAKTFSVVGKNGEEIVGEVTVTNNKDRTSIVYLPLQNYNTVMVIVHKWSIPNRRVRIENILIGHVLKFTKSDLLSFTHEMDGDLLSGKLPKYSIEFTLDNSDGRWDPNNPTGMAQYLSERQKITVKYGLELDDKSIEWIKAGTFYLSEWYAPPNGLEARFVARDIFEFMMGVEMSNSNTATISGLINSAIPEGFSAEYDSTLPNYTYTYAPTTTKDTAAEMVQKCANAVGAILRFDREGILHIEPLKEEVSEYIYLADTTGIPLALSYSYPEITLSKPLKDVSVDYGGESPFTFNEGANGETQTLANEYIANATNAERVATWVYDVLKNRKTISGEFRADPRLDLYDIVRVEDRYSIVRVEDRYSGLLTVAITNIKYTFNGSFRGSYTGRILEEV